MQSSSCRSSFVYAMFLQGLHATVNVLHVELVSINKEEQCVILSDKRKLQYGLLLLAVGLDRTDASMQQQLQDSCNVVSSQDLQGVIPRVCGSLSAFNLDPSLS